MANLNLSSEEIHNPNIVNPNIGSISSQRNIATLVSRVLENKETTTKVIQNEFINLFSKNIQIGIQAVNKFHDEFKKKLNKLPKIEHLPAVE